MADTSLSAQIEHDYKVSKWSRNTVADGSWLQKYTVDKLTNRDIFLANAIDTLNSGTDENLSSLSAAISYVSATHDEYIDYLSATLSENIDNVSALNERVSSFSSEYKTFFSATNERFNNIESNADGLQNQIDQLKIATDVVAVFGTYDEFVAGSGDLGVTDNDTIKVLRDDHYTPSATDEDYESNDDDGFQVYYEWHDPNAETQHTDWTGWSAIGSLDPYYSVAEIDDYIDQINDELDSLSSTVANNYLSANTQAVIPGKNIVVTEKTGPIIEIKTSAEVEFDKINGTSVSSLINSAKSGYAASAYITAHSGDFLNSAHSAYNKLTFKYGNSTKDYQANSSAYSFIFSAGAGVNFITGNNQITISSEGTTYQAGDYISTANKTISVTGLGSIIGSAQSGKRAYNILSSSKISAISPTFTANDFGYLSAGFRISAGDNLIISTAANNTFKLNAKPSIDTTFSNIWYESGAEPLGETGTITGITAKYNNDVNSHNYIVNQSVVFGTSGNEDISGLLIQPAKPAENGYVLTYNSYQNSYTWQPGGATYTTANESIVIDNGLKTIGLASSISSDNLVLYGKEITGATYTTKVIMNGEYISANKTNQVGTTTAKTYWMDLARLNYVSSCNPLDEFGRPAIKISACATLPSVTSMQRGIYYLV